MTTPPKPEKVKKIKSNVKFENVFGNTGKKVHSEIGKESFSDVLVECEMGKRAPHDILTEVDNIKVQVDKIYTKLVKLSEDLYLDGTIEFVLDTYFAEIKFTIKK